MQSYTSSFRPQAAHPSDFINLGQISVQSDFFDYGSKLPSELKPTSSANEGRNKDGYLLSALNSENRQKESGMKQSFMNKLSSAMPIVKEVSFGGGAQSSFGVISGLPSTSTCKNKDSSIIPATAQS